MSAATMAERHDRARVACIVSSTGEHTCLDDPELAADYAAWVAQNSHARSLADDLTRQLDAERARWVRDGCPTTCVRPAGEAFGWRQGSGPCDCPPCLTATAAAHVPYDAGTDSSEGD